MIRTQIYLPETLHRKLKFLKKTCKKSIAEIIRAALERHLREEPEDGSQENDILELSNLKIRGGPSNLSSSIDEVLYSGK